jgi:hypothetical protein
MSFASVRLHKGTKAERQESNFASTIIPSYNAKPPAKKRGKRA